MGYISYNPVGTFQVKLEGAEDKAALKAALKATPGADEGEPADRSDTLSFDADNPSNVLAFWAADFDWESRAMKVALDQLAPLAWQHVGIHSQMLRGFRKKDKEMFAGLSEAVRKKHAETEESS